MGEDLDTILRHNCGLTVAHTLHDAYLFIQSLQHRGREAAGIAAIGNDRIDVIKWEGPVNRFDLFDLHKILNPTRYHTFFAHVRYATSGRKDRLLEDAHPHTIGGRIERHGNHVLVLDCELAAVHNGQVDDRYLSSVDKNTLTTTCDTEALLHLFRDIGERGIMKTIPGAYNLAIADRRRKDVIVMRDRTGFHPIVLGWKDGKHAVASEDIAIRQNGGTFVEDLQPGFIYYLEPNGGYRKEKVVEEQTARSFFEFNYLMHTDSIFDGRPVRRVRELLGEKLAQEYNPKNIDLVTFLPRCPEVAARSYARITGLPFEYIFYKTRGERSFQGSDSRERQQSIEHNLYLLPDARELLRKKRIVVVDDSMVRGNNSKHARKLVVEEGRAQEITLASYTPPIGIIGDDGIPRGCMFGVDMPPNDKFIARGRTVEQISAEVGMNVVYLSRKGMLDVFKIFGMTEDRLCTYCIGGKHPFGDMQANVLKTVQ